MKTKRGISLIVLVITIIVMIILAAAVIISLTDSDLIDNANTAVKDTDIKQVEHIAAMAWSSAYIKKHKGDDSINLTDEVNKALVENGLNPDNYNINVTEKGVTVTVKEETVTAKWELKRTTDANGKVTAVVVTNGIDTYDVGTTVNYMPEGVGTTNYKGGWKILGADDEGRLLIVSTADKGVTGNTFNLNAQDGFINGVTLLNNEVNSYKDGIIGVDVRSITIEDIDNVTGYEKTTFGSGITKYGREISLAWNSTGVGYTYLEEGKNVTGNLGHPHTGGITYYDETTNKFVTSSKATTGDIVTISNEDHSYTASTVIDNTTPAYKMLFGEKGNLIYFLASPYKAVKVGYISYGMYFISSDSVTDSYFLVNSFGGVTGDIEQAIRAVVTLASDVKLTESTTTAGTYDLSK